MKLIDIKDFLDNCKIEIDNTQNKYALEFLNDFVTWLNRQQCKCRISSKKIEEYLIQKELATYRRSFLILKHFREIPEIGWKREDVLACLISIYALQKLLWNK